MFNWFKKSKKDQEKKEILNYYDRGFYEDCLELCDAKWDSSEIDLEIICIHVDCHFRLENAKKALEIINRGLELYPNEETLISQKIYALHSSKQYSEAFELSTMLINKNPKNRDFLFAHAWILSQQDKLDESIKIYKSILSLDNPNNNLTKKSKGLLDEHFNPNEDVWALNNLGYDRMKIGEYDEAIENFKKAIKIDPYFAFAFNNLGFAYLKIGKLEIALECIDYSIELDPDNSYAYKNRALYFLEIGEIQNAIKDLKIAEELDFEKLYGDEVNLLLEKLNGQ